MADIDLPVFSFSPNWKNGVTERLEWRTDVMRSALGYEQRRSIRLTPRRFFDTRFNPIDADRTFMDLWLHQFGAQEFLLPIWHDKAKLSAPALAGATRLDLDNTFREFVTGDLAMLRRSTFDYQVVLISGQDANGLNLDVSTPLAAGWDSGSVVHPLAPAYQEGNIARLGALTGRVGEASLGFRLSRNNIFNPGAETLPLYAGYPVISKEPNRIATLDAQYENLFDELDHETGPVYRRSETDRSFPTRFYDWMPRGRQEHYELRQQLYRLNGRQKAVWMPSFNRDLILARPHVSGTSRLDVQEVGYKYLGGPKTGREYVRLYDDTGVMRIVRVTNTGVPAAAGEERLTLSAATAFNADTGRVADFMDLMRLDQDDVEITHQTDTDGVSEAGAAFKSFRAGRDPSGTLVLPAVVGVESDDSCGSPAVVEESVCLVMPIVFPGWYAKARIKLIAPTTGMPSFYVDPDGPTGSIFHGAEVPGLREYDPDNFGVTVYFTNPLVMDSTEVDLRLQFPSGSVGAEMRAQFSFQKWNEDPVIFTGGSSPKATSTVISPGTPSQSLGNPFDVRGLWPDNWYFAA